MRTAEDFNSFYETPDPWRISRFHVRDNVLRRWLSRLVKDKTVLELGCGEGHLTEAIFRHANSVTGIDLSKIAIARARSLKLPNASFKIGDFLEQPFEGFDLIAAIECVSYLSDNERAEFFAKIAREHAGKIFVLSTPIIGGRYFTHRDIVRMLETFRFTLIDFYNLTAYWHPLPLRVVANLIKLPLGYRALDWLPEWMIYQRLYIARAG
jgi:SAM-dependent methyltransferase